jgi:Cu-Zn family superoxide dismutase
MVGAAVLSCVVFAAGGASAQAGHTGHAASAPPTVSAEGPTFVHDPAFSDVRVEVRAIDIPFTSLSIAMTTVRGFPSSTRGKVFGAHIHARSCAADPAASGGHYANPSGDPTKSLAAREVWLDLSIDSLGRGVSFALFDWRIRRGDALSDVIHAEPTNATSGVAGARILCTNVAFGS